MEQFTRGNPGDPDRRGETLVQKHAERLQADKENMALAALAVTAPEFAAVTRAVALSECGWDGDTAVIMLRRFKDQCSEKLAALAAKRKRIVEGGVDGAADAADGDKPAAKRRAAGGSSDSSGASSSSSSSGSDSDSGDSSGSSSDGGRRRHKSKSSKSSKHRRSKDKKLKDKKSKKSKSHKKSKRSSKEKDKKRRRSRSRSRSAERKEDKAKIAFGKYGILRETDMSAKYDEFRLWTLEVKKRNIETLSRIEEKELWRDFAEDFNTSTLPHRKYYDLNAYERERMEKMVRKAQAKGGAVKPVARIGNEEEEIARQRAAARQVEQAARLKEALALLQSSGKAEEMRHQELLRQRAAFAHRTGDSATAARIMERLQPDDKR